MRSIALPEGVSHHHYEELGSTQDKVNDFKTECSSTCFQLVTADFQTRGRGTQNRVWHSAIGKNILMTLLMPRPQDWSIVCLKQAVGLAFALFLQECYKLEPKIKWFNDVKVEGKKICGILCEFDGNFLKVGIGFNVNKSKEECSAVDQPTTSLSLVTSRDHDRGFVLQHLLHALIPKLKKLNTTTYVSSVLPELLPLLLYSGELIRFAKESGETIEGVINGVNEQGYLLVNHTPYERGRILGLVETNRKRLGVTLFSLRMIGGVTAAGAVILYLLRWRVGQSTKIGLSMVKSIKNILSTAGNQKGCQKLVQRTLKLSKSHTT